MCSLYFICLQWLEWQPPEFELPSRAPSPFILLTAAGGWNSRLGFIQKKKKNIQEMKVVTRSSVCQTSPWAGTKGSEKCCCAFFTQQIIEKEKEKQSGKGGEKRKQKNQWMFNELLRCRNWGERCRREPFCNRKCCAFAALCAQSPSSHRYSYTKQNKLLIPALQCFPACLSWERENFRPSCLVQDPVKCDWDDTEGKTFHAKIFWIWL